MVRDLKQDHSKTDSIIQELEKEIETKDFQVFNLGQEIVNYEKQVETLHDRINLIENSKDKIIMKLKAEIDKYR